MSPKFVTFLAAALAAGLLLYLGFALLKPEKFQ
jgi:K+-transporting ATPase KdpF subunit